MSVRTQLGSFVVATVLVTLMPACEKPLPDTDCEVAADCALIVTGDPCGWSANCGCGPESMAGNRREQEEFQARYDQTVCLPELCFEMALCAIRVPTLYCFEGECGVVYDDEAPPDGADVQDNAG